MAVLTAALLSACAATPSQPAPAEATDPNDSTPFIAGGHEPGWQLQLLGDHAELQRFGEPVPARMRISAIDSSADLTRLSVDSALGAVSIRIAHSLCRDSCSGLPHPDNVSIDLPDRQLRGCGGDPHALLRAQPWQLAIVEVAAPVALLSFGEAKRLQLQGPCSDYLGEYTLSGEGLRLQLTKVSRERCAGTNAEAEEPELQLLQRLAAVQRHDFGPAGELRLLSADGSYLTAVAAPTE
jgi:uncharacterized membrane protein/heat shock protein HslJ